MEQSQRWKNMLQKYGTEKAARQEMQRRAALSSRNKSGAGGFAKLKAENPELFMERAKRGGKNSAAKRWPTGENAPESKETNSQIN